MAARATSSGTISFGLVSIPIKVYTAASPKTVRFNMLHETDKARLKQQLVCSGCGVVVVRSETVKGYEYSRGQYVVMSDEELKALEQKSDQSIEIEDFIPMEQVDARYFEKSNLLGPDKGGAKAYRLLNEAMTVTGRVAIGRFSSRGRQQLVLIRPLARGLMMHGLYYADEVRDFDDIEFGDDVALKAGELELPARPLRGPVPPAGACCGGPEGRRRRGHRPAGQRGPRADRRPRGCPQAEPREQG